MSLKSFSRVFIAISLILGQDAYGHPGKGRNKTTVADPAEDAYNVVYVKMDLQASNTSTQITGQVLTRARTVLAMNEYVFELSPQLVIDSAKLDGLTLPVISSNFVRRIVLQNPLSPNTNFTAEVFYHGQPTGGTGFFTNGLIHGTDASVPVDVTHTVSAAIHSRDWWPCKQSLTDKIDSADIFVTVPTGLKVAGNGILKNITSLGSFDRFEWSVRYPSDYYLLSFSIAPYNEYSYYMHFSGSSDSMLVQNFLYNDPNVLLQHQDELDSIGLIIDYFSGLFGRYPFWKEKFGICQTPLGGGMENQTMVSLGSLDASLIAHELSHQWWGDNVTCSTLKDMWLNEGFATYAEDLFLEHFWGQNAALSDRTDKFNYAMQNLGGSVYVDDTTTELRIYDGRLTYSKGAAVVHMLRYFINNDSLFFESLRQYQQQFSFGNAATGSLQDIAAQVSGLSLDTFFHQWIFQEGFPTYSAKWYQNSAQQVFIRLLQTTSKPLSVPVFKLPVEIRLSSPQGDTIVRVNNDQSIQYYSFTWNKPLTGITIDPNNHIVNKTGPVTMDSTLSIPSWDPQTLQIFPNPALTGWHLRNVPEKARLSLFDMQGRKIWTAIVSSEPVFIPADQLRSGIYHLLVKPSSGPASNYQLLR